MSPQEREKTLAAQYRATARPDQARGNGWCKYELHGWHIWYCGTKGWACARLEKNHYCHHRYNHNLEECFEFACTVQADTPYLGTATKQHHMNQ